MKRLWVDPRERARFVKFAIVGTFGAVLDFGVFNLLISFGGVTAILANVISFTVAVTSNYFLNRYWTYPDSRSKRVSRQFSEYVVINLMGVGIRTGIFALVEPFMERTYLTMPHPAELSKEFFGHNAALAAAIAIVLLWNYFANRYWTYADVD